MQNISIMTPLFFSEGSFENIAPRTEQERQNQFTLQELIEKGKLTFEDGDRDFGSRVQILYSPEQVLIKTACWYLDHQMPQGRDQDQEEQEYNTLEEWMLDEFGLKIDME